MIGPQRPFDLWLRDIRSRLVPLVCPECGYELLIGPSATGKVIIHTFNGTHTLGYSKVVTGEPKDLQSYADPAPNPNWPSVERGKRRSR